MTATTIGSILQIDEEALAEKASESGYWLSCYDFYMKMKDRSPSQVSKAQMDWLLRISDAL